MEVVTHLAFGIKTHSHQRHLALVKLPNFATYLVEILTDHIKGDKVFCEQEQSDAVSWLAREVVETILSHPPAVLRKCIHDAARLHLRTKAEYVPPQYAEPAADFSKLASKLSTLKLTILSTVQLLLPIKITSLTEYPKLLSNMSAIVTLNAEDAAQVYHHPKLVADAIRHPATTVPSIPTAALTAPSTTKAKRARRLAAAARRGVKERLLKDAQLEDAIQQLFEDMLTKIVEDTSPQLVDYLKTEPDDSLITTCEDDSKGVNKGVDMNEHNGPECRICLRGMAEVWCLQPCRHA